MVKLTNFVVFWFCFYFLKVKQTYIWIELGRILGPNTRKSYTVSMMISHSRIEQKEMKMKNIWIYQVLIYDRTGLRVFLLVLGHQALLHTLRVLLTSTGTEKSANNANSNLFANRHFNWEKKIDSSVVSRKLKRPQKFNVISFGLPGFLELRNSRETLEVAFRDHFTDIKMKPRRPTIVRRGTSLFKFKCSI